MLTTLGSVVQRLTDLDSLMPDLRTLCARHIKYGVEMEHYDILASACLSTMEVPSHPDVCRLMPAQRVQPFMCC